MSSNPAGPLPLCFVVDDEPAIGRFVALALRGFGGVDVEQFIDLASMTVALGERGPDLIFLDISLGSSDAIEAIRHLSTVKYPGVVQLMSGSDAFLLDDVRLIGERHGLRMRPAITKPFRIEAIKAIIEEERLLLGGAHAAPTKPSEARAAAPAVDLLTALANDWVEIWYQPKINLDGLRVTGAEGLARVRHPEHGVLPPSAFLPQASVATLIALAERALHTVLHDASSMAAAGHRMRLAVNMPVEALLALPLASIAREARPKGDDWSGIIIEVTEDQVIRDIAAAHEIATQLRIHHITLALDDFGSGYSSLARLKELPFAELKLDRSFVTGCGVDAANAALCRMAVELAHRFGSLAVAEGIETASDLTTIRRMGCDTAQGFFFARPMPREALLARLLANGSSAFSSGFETDSEDGAARVSRKSL